MSEPIDEPIHDGRRKTLGQLNPEPDTACSPSGKIEPEPETLNSQVGWSKEASARKRRTHRFGDMSGRNGEC